MNCRHADSLIQRSLDVPLTPPERSRLDAHLASCDACRRAWEEYRRLSQATSAWARRPGPAGTPPDAFTAQVLARVAARSMPDRLPSRRLAAVLCLIVLVALSPVVSPLLPPLMGGHAGWAPPSAGGLLLWLRTLPPDLSGLWASADGLIPARLAADVLLLALPLNALLCLRARRGGRGAA